MTGQADVIVIGLGAAGSASLYQLARRGTRVLGVDRFTPPHDRGSSHGETRITRQAIAEGLAYVPLVLRSHEIWRELEAQTGETLLQTCGFAAIEDEPGTQRPSNRPGFVQRTIAAALHFNIDHEILRTEDARHRFPAFDLPPGARLYLEPGGGMVFPERCIAAQLKLAARLGAQIRPDECVRQIDQTSASVRVVTDRAEYQADQVIVCAGSWAPGLLGGALRHMRLFRQTLHWFAPDDARQYAPDRFPAFVWACDTDAGEGKFYGLPIPAAGTPGVKVATEQYTDFIERPEDLERSVTPSESTSMHEQYVAGRLLGLSSRPIKSTACLYTQAPDNDFAIGRSPDMQRVIIVSACSGHGFKHSAAIGEAAAKMVLDDDSVDLTFSLTRPALS